MTDERAIRLLEEIRDLQREQASRQAEMFALQQGAVQNQLQSVAVQGQAVDLQRRVMRRLLPVFTIVVLVLVALVLAWIRARLA